MIVLNNFLYFSIFISIVKYKMAKGKGGRKMTKQRGGETRSNSGGGGDGLKILGFLGLLAIGWFVANSGTRVPYNPGATHRAVVGPGR